MRYTDYAKSQKEYAESYPSASFFTGVDFTNNPSSVALYRLAYAENMYRNYHSENGGAIETICGYRKLKQFSGNIHGLYHYKTSSASYLMVHAGTNLYRIAESGLDSIGDPSSVGTLADADSTFFTYNDRLYVLDGTNFKTLQGVGNLEDVSGYVPITYIDGEAYEQRNLLINKSYEMPNYTSGTEPISPVGTRESGNYVGTSEFVISEENINLGAFPSGTQRCKFLKQVGHTLTMTGTTTVKSVALSGTVTVSDSNATALDEFIVPSTATVSFAEGSLVNAKKVRLGCNYSLGNMSASTLTEHFNQCVNLYAKGGEYELPTDDALSYSVSLQSSIAFTDQTCMEVYQSGTRLYVRSTSDNPSESVTGQKYALSIRVKTTDFAYKDYLYIIYYDGGETPTAATEYSFTLNDDPSLKMYTLYEKTSSIDKAYVNGQEVTAFLVSGDVDKVVLSASEGDEIKVKLNLAPSYMDSTAYTDVIKKCKKIAIYDDRVFYSGHPSFPSTVWYSQRDNLGLTNPSYVGELNYFQDGREKINSLLATGSMLMVICENNIFYHTPSSVDDIVTKTYPSTQGNSGIGGVGASMNFLDDPIFMSKNGVNGVSKETLTLERTIGHRSTNVDAMLIEEPNLSNAEFVEWDGYLCCFVNGNVYMADSRAMFQNIMGNYEYEWYYLTGIGTYLTESSGSFSRVKYWDTPTGDIYGYIDGTVGTDIVGLDSFYFEGDRDIILKPNEVFQLGYGEYLTIDKGNGVSRRYPPYSTFLPSSSFTQISIQRDTITYVPQGTPQSSMTIREFRKAPQLYLLVDGSYVELDIPTTITKVLASECFQTNAYYLDGDTYKRFYVDANIEKYTQINGKYYFVAETDEFSRGNTFVPSKHPSVIGERLLFGDSNGNVYCFNNDKRGTGVVVNGVMEQVNPKELHRSFYSFDGCSINSCLSTKLDNCNIPHLTKKTTSKSLVIRAKVMDSNRVDLWVYTDYKPVFRKSDSLSLASTNMFNQDYENVSFFSFEDKILVGREKESHWVEKQYLLRDGGFRCPFGIYNMTFRYTVQGRVKL